MNGKPFRELTAAERTQIRRETARRDATEPRAKAARYDRKTDRLIVELKNGVVMMIPTHLLQGVAGAEPKLIAKVETDERGFGLHWEELDADLTVPGLLAGCFGSARWMDDLREQGLIPTAAPTASEMGRKGGSASTLKKRSASRANGKLGGRPRKQLDV